MNKLIILIFVLFIFNCKAQDKDVIITDTIVVDTLKFHNLVFKKCPGIMSGIPCLRYLQLINGRVPKRKNIINECDNIIYQMDNQNLILNLNDYKYNPLFKDFIRIDKKGIKSELFLLTNVDSKKKWQLIEGMYVNAKIYIVKMKLTLINKILENNIMINLSSDYADVYLIVNSTD